MSGLRFWKTQTVGNDFVLLHGSDLAKLGLEDEGATLAQSLCERRFGIGSDGLLVVLASGSELQMRMFNPDGTEDFCGNGLRCVAVHAVRLGWVAAEHRIEHFGRLVHAVVAPDGTAKTAIGPAVYDSEEVPLDTSLHPGPLIDQDVHGYVGSALNAGSTHFVTFVSSLPGDEEFERVGPMIEHAPDFPERTSVIFAQQTGERSIKIRIWERGVGETLGCGTGSSAAAAELMRRNGKASDVRVENPGGLLVVHASEIGGSLVTASKPVETFSGLIELPVRLSV